MAKKNKKNQTQEKETASEAISKKFKQNPGIYIGSVVILVLVVVTFLGGDLLSGGRFGSGGGDLIFGYYDKVPISYVPGNYLAQNYENITRYYQAQGIDVQDFRNSAQIWRWAYEGALTHTAVLQIMKRSNYAVPDRIVDREMARLPQFQENGRFSQTLFRQTPESVRISLRRQELERLTKNMFFSDFSGLLISEGEASFIAEMASPLRSYEMVMFQVDDYPDSEFISYAMENPRLFNSIHMSKITINSSEREARRILALIQEGTTTFEEAARNYSQDGFFDRGGDMSSRFLYEFDYEIINPADRDRVYNMRPGEISDVILTANGWVFYRVENPVVTADFEDEIVMDRVRSYVRAFERGRMEDWSINMARDFINDVLETDFENASYLWNLERSFFGPLAMNFGSVDLFTSLESFSISDFSSQYINQLANNENFWRTIYSTQLNMPSEPLVQGSNIIVFIPVEEADADELFIDSIKSMYSGWWLNYVTEQLMQQYFLHTSRADDRFWESYFNFFW